MLLPSPTTSAASSGELMPTPRAGDGEKGGPNQRGSSGDLMLPSAVNLLPTPDSSITKYRLAGDSQQSRSLPAMAIRGELDATVRQPSRWGKYAAAIERWERLTRPAPEPTVITAGYTKARAKRLAGEDKRPVGMRGSLKVRRQLAAAFSEWMMGVPAGWITDVPGITRNEALKAAGNGVVPQQAAEALRFLLGMPTGREIADAAEPIDLLELLAAGA